MGIRPYIIEAVIPSNLSWYRPDFIRPGVRSENSPEDPATTCRELVAEVLPWLHAEAAGIREYHLGPFTAQGDETRLTVLALASPQAISRIPNDGERLTLRKPSCEIFHSDDHVTYFVCETGIEPITGDVALDAIAAGQVEDVGCNLREFLWHPVTEQLEELLKSTKGNAWFARYEQDVYAAEITWLGNVELGSLCKSELEMLAQEISQEIEAEWGNNGTIAKENIHVE
jgi:hypothetical protein